MKHIYLYGASGHAKVVLEIAEAGGYTVAGLVDANPAIEELLGYPVNAAFEEKTEGNWLIAIGKNTIRKKIAEEKKRQFGTLIHPQATLSKRSYIAEGTVIMAGATVNAEAHIGRHCIVNTNASVDHDCILEDYVHLSPNVALAGGVQVGEGTHIGIGACVIQGVCIGRWCTVGAGAVIIRDVPDGTTVVGNPGKVIRTNAV